jgi:hypothetical protein
MSGATVSSKLALAGMLAAVFCIVGAPTAAQAQRRERDYRQACESRLQSARVRLDEDMRRFGPRDRRVDRDRARLEQARQWCRSHKADWDHDRFDRDGDGRPDRR